MGLSDNRKIPTRAVLRMGLLVALVGTGILLVRFTPLGEVLTEERVVSVIETMRGLWWTPLLLIGLYAVVAILGLPPVPLLVGGAAFGALYGTIYNVAGLVLGAFLAYWVAKLLGRDFVVRVTGKRLRRAESLFARHGFWPMVQTRFMPLPFSVVNFGAALAGVRPAFFLFASLIGLIPSTLIHTYFIAEAIETQGRERAFTLALYAGAFVLFNALLSILWLRERVQRQKRYRELVGVRAHRREQKGPVGDPRPGKVLDRL
jgi:uncharacterized membrane protein YdjX (TVP38/TMEM64 family)